MPTLLPISDAASYLGVTPKTLRRWEEAGRLSPKRTNGNQRRYSFEDLEHIKVNRAVDPRESANENASPHNSAFLTKKLDSLDSKLGILEDKIEEAPAVVAKLDELIAELKKQRTTLTTPPPTIPTVLPVTQRSLNEVGSHAHPAFSAILVSLVLVLLFAFGIGSFAFINPSSFKGTVLSPLASLLLEGGAKVQGSMRFLSPLFFGPTDSSFIFPSGDASFRNLSSSSLATNSLSASSLTANQLTTKSLTTDYLTVTRSETIAGLNAQFLNSFSSSQFLRSDTSTSFTQGTLTFVPGTTLQVSGNLNAAGPTSLSSLTVSGSSSLNSLSVTGNTTNGGNLTVSGSQTISGSLTVSGPTTLSGGATISCTGCVTDQNVVDALTINQGSITNTPIASSTISGSPITSSIINSTPIGNSSPSTGNFTTLSSSSFAVSGLTAGSVLFAGAAGAISQNNANFFWDNSNNRLGVGTASPGATLNVVGTTKFGSENWPTSTYSQTGNRVLLSGTTNPWLILNNAATTPAIDLGGEIYLGSRATSGVDNAAYARIIGAKENSTSGNFASYLQLKTLTAGGTENTGVRIDSGGNVGIGTTGPNALLDVRGNTNLGAVGTASTLSIYSSNATGTGAYATLSTGTTGRLTLAAGQGSAATNNEVALSSHLLFTTDNSNDIGASGATRPRTEYLGTALAIGTNPASAGGIRLSNNTNIKWRNAANTADIDGVYVNAGDILHLSSGGTSSVVTDTGLNFNSDNIYDIGASGATRPRSVYTGTSFVAPAGVVTAPSYTFTGNTNTGIFSSAANTIDLVSASTSMMQITSTGAIAIQKAGGLGGGNGPMIAMGYVTSAPTVGVANQGMLYISSGALKYQGPSTLTQLAAADYAEAMPYTGELNQAEVVSASSTPKTNADLYNNFFVERTTSAYDGKLLGVVSSTSPETNNTTRMIALVGRVPVKFSTENGQVVPGDPLTSSGTKAGYAMKAVKAGRIIGIALQAVSTDGEVLIFVNPGWFDPQTVVNNQGTVTNPAAPTTGETVAVKDRQLTLTKITADSGIFQTIQATVYAAFEVLTTKTAQIAEAAIDNLTAKKAKVDDLEVLNKIQLRDQATGEMYCTWIEKGEWQKVLGPCSSTNQTNNQNQTSQQTTTIPQ